MTWMDRADWLRRWRSDLETAGLGQNDRLGRKLIARHGQSWRRYHGLSHLRFLFGEIDTLCDEVTDRNRLVFATWFHDAVYLSWRKDNEARSARWASKALSSLGAGDTLTRDVDRQLLEDTLKMFTDRDAEPATAGAPINANG